MAVLRVTEERITCDACGVRIQKPFPEEFKIAGDCRILLAFYSPGAIPFRDISLDLCAPCAGTRINKLVLLARAIIEQEHPRE